MAEKHYRSSLRALIRGSHYGVNEAFVVLALANMHLLGLDPEKVRCHPEQSIIIITVTVVSAIPPLYLRRSTACRPQGSGGPASLLSCILSCPEA
jgi:hypothetical protein